MTSTGGGGARVELADWGWRHSGRDAWSLRGVDLVVEPGERVLLLGASGAGKSTLLHALAGLTGASGAISGDEEGRLRVDGEPAGAARGAAALVSQDPETQLVMARCGDDVAFGPENLGLDRDEIWSRVRGALDEVGFGYGPDRPTAALSGGEKQRLVLAGALAMRPRLLLLDEPTANLDRGGAARVRRVLQHLLRRSEATMVLVEHRVAEVVGDSAHADTETDTDTDTATGAADAGEAVADLVDRVVVVEPGGGVVADGPPSAVFADSGRRLAEQGVWVPGREPRPQVPAGAPGAAVVEAADCTARAPGTPGLLGDRGTPVLHGVDAVVRAGCATALTGPNGAGKSTLLGLLAGLDAPDGGTVAPRGPLADVSPRPLAKWPARRLARHVGTVFQHAEDQFVTASVREELAFAPRRAGLGRRDTNRRVDELLERLRLTGLADVHPFTLSGGEKRRLSVATALSSGASHAPGVLLLDEPTFGQDTRTWRELVELLAQLRADGRAVVAATHDTALLRSFADVEIPLSGGCTGTPIARTAEGAKALGATRQDAASAGDAGSGPVDGGATGTAAAREYRNGRRATGGTGKGERG
ncbi:ABC transporter ATP-binding protein [Streptomonospora litoralis]|uniref:HMP/thiamine import ATP-binding protein YkoD n=1 Tax=Streptomonospora litoralis TaxID=2498135 RepID=A0A4P6PXS9_9ACTN|nr:ABC transporter ATP-binding protein [Streptomonospora litoralis]QBI52945.1 Putative HMP/thiamine import ATP-binding protein YkoD [Streptomonospora litoralis]